MAPHLSPAEQDYIAQAAGAGKPATDIFKAIASQRGRRGVEMVSVTAIRRFMRGRSHRRGKIETRGRKRKFSRRNVLAMDTARHNFIKATKGTRQANWDVVRSKARAPMAHRATVARAFKREGLDVQLRSAHPCFRDDTGASLFARARSHTRTHAYAHTHTHLSHGARSGARTEHVRST